MDWNPKYAALIKVDNIQQVFHCRAIFKFDYSGSQTRDINPETNLTESTEFSNRIVLNLFLIQNKAWLWTFPIWEQ